MRNDARAGWPATVLLPLLVLGGGCATTGPVPPEGSAGAGSVSPVVLRVNDEAFTRADLQRLNPQLFATGVTHGKMLGAAFLQRFVDFRLAVQEARRRGLESSEAFTDRSGAYYDAKCAETLVAELKIPEEKPGEFADDALAEDLIADQRRAVIRARLRERGLDSAPRTAREHSLLEALSGADDAVLAEVGRDQVTVGEVRALCTRIGKSTPTESDAARALDELVLYREVVAAARAAGHRDRVTGSEAAAGFREKLLEALLGEALVPPGSLPAAAVAEYYAANLPRYERLEAIRLRRIVLSQSDAAAVFKRLRSGEDFAALAKEHSIDAATAAAGGDLGWVAPGTAGIPPQAFALKVGELSRLARGSGGYETLRAEERRVATPALAAVEDQVRRDAEAAARGKAMRDLVAELRATARIWKSEELAK